MRGRIYMHCYINPIKSNKREYLVNILIMPELQFHFLSVVADRLQDGPAAFPHLRNESESADWALLKC